MVITVGFMIFSVILFKQPKSVINGIGAATSKDHWGSIGIAEICQYRCYCGVLINSQYCFLPIASTCSLRDRCVTTPCSLVEMCIAVETAHNQSGSIGWSKRNPITSTSANGDFFFTCASSGMRGYSLSGYQACMAEGVPLGCACYLEGCTES